MTTNDKASRRRFLKMAAGGAAGLPFIQLGDVCAASSAWSPKKPINPDIDNMKVVCCFDTAMLKNNAVMTNFTSQNNAVNADKVYANLDAMACRLAAKQTADQAWRAIFRSSKAWADTRVAIKVNTVNTYCMPRIAVIAKLCTVLTGFGVQGKNIVIYDGGNNAFSAYNSYCSLTDTTKINAVVSDGNASLGNTTPVTIDGWTAKQYYCTTDIASGAVDILINFAVNKGHDRSQNGYFTLCMKNHYGTFGAAVDFHGSTTPFISINKHAALIGGTPVRQQLCIIDSLTGSIAHNPGTAPDVANPCRLIMGTFAPAVDYCCVKNVREPIMKAVHDPTLVDGLLSYFGYANTDPQWQEFDPKTEIKTSQGPHQGSRHVSICLNHDKFGCAPVHFELDNSPSDAINVSITDIAGNQIMTHRIAEGNNLYVWNGKSDGGRTISKGLYVIRLWSGNWSDAKTIRVY